MQLPPVVQAALCALLTMHSTEACAISKRAYVERLYVLMCPCESTWALGLMFFELYAAQMQLVVASIEPAQLLATWGAAMVLALKWNEDHHYRNSEYAEIMGVPLAELNNLERKIFAAVILVWWNVNTPDTVAQYYDRLRTHLCNLCPTPAPPQEAGPPRSVWRSVRRSVSAKVNQQRNPWRRNKLLSRVARRLMLRKCTALRKHRAARHPNGEACRAVPRTPEEDYTCAETLSPQ